MPLKSAPTYNSYAIFFVERFGTQKTAYADDSSPNSIVARFLTVAGLYLPEPVVAQLVHQTIFHCISCQFIYPVLHTS